MPITNDAELASAAAEAGLLLQQIQDYAGQQFSPFAKVRFPRGYIRTAEQARDQFPFLPASAFKSNLSYAMMLCDVQKWVLARTDLFGTAKEMVVKLQIFMLGNVAESVTKVHLRGQCGGNYKKRTEFMVDRKLIQPDLKVELDWLWDMRNLMHLFQVEEHEWLSKDYTAENYQRAARALNALTEALHGV
jgi:hypothetical protein